MSIHPEAGVFHEVPSIDAMERSYRSTLALHFYDRVSERCRDRKSPALTVDELARMHKDFLGPHEVGRLDLVPEALLIARFHAELVLTQVERTRRIDVRYGRHSEPNWEDDLLKAAQNVVDTCEGYLTQAGAQLQPPKHS